MAVSALEIESHSIDYVPLAERHGKVWHLWPVWFTGDAHLATLAVGVLGITLGTNLFWTAVHDTLSGNGSAKDNLATLEAKLTELRGDGWK